MKKSVLLAASFLLCIAVTLSGCKAIIDKQRASEAAALAETQAEAEEASGYDTTSPKSAAWFDNAVFVGDSVTLKLSYYCAEHPEALGKAEFFCAGSLGYTNALWAIDDPEAVHPYYQGETRLAEDCVALTGKNNVFIMLGMNDIGLYGVDGAMDSCKQLVERIMKKSPQAHLYLQSVTPMIKSAQVDSFNNQLVQQFNAKLKAFCDSGHYRYLDVFSALADKDGNLPDELCSDPEVMGLHFNDTSCDMWANYLKNNA